MLPLHYVAAWRANSDEGPPTEGQVAMVEHILKAYPVAAATLRDGSGRLPLHAAILGNAPLSVLKALLRVNPAAGETVCRFGGDAMLNFPLALTAAASDCDLESIFVLLRHVLTITKRQRTTFVSNRKRKSPT